MMKKRRAICGLLGIIFSACIQPIGPAAPQNPAKGLVVIGISGGDARTLMPSDPVFTKYDMLFHCTSDAGIADVPLNNISPGEISGGVYQELEPGTWTVTVTAYVNLSPAGTPTDYVAATGSETITLTARNTVSKTVNISPAAITGTGNGVFRWNINISGITGIGSAYMDLKDDMGTSVLGSPKDLTGYPSGSVELVGGSYELTITLVKETAHAGKSAAVQIYPGFETPAVFTFTNADFAANAYIEGMAEITKPADLTLGTTITVRAYKDASYFNLLGQVTTVSGNWNMQVPVNSPVYFTLSVTGDGRTFSGGAGSIITNVPENGKSDIPLSMTIHELSMNPDPPTGGSIGMSVSGTPTFYAVAGEKVSLTVYPDPGKTLGTLAVKRNPGPGTVPVTNFTFLMPNEDVKIEATFVSAEKAITSFSLAGAQGFITNSSETEGRIAVTVPYGTDLTSIAPTFTLGHSGARMDHVTSGTADLRNFTAGPLTYTVTAPDGSSTRTYTVTATVAKIKTIGIISGALLAPNGFKKTRSDISGEINDISGEIKTKLTSVRGTDSIGTPITIAPSLYDVDVVVPAATGVNIPVTLTVPRADTYGNPITYDENPITAPFNVYIKNDARQITSFTFAGAPGFITNSTDGTTGTIDVTVPYNTTISGVTPVYTTSPGAGVSSSEGLAWTGGTKVYRVTAEDGTTRDYTVTVTVVNSPDKEITAFSITSPVPVPAAGTLLGTTFTVTVPYGTLRNSMAASITFTGASITIGGVLANAPSATINNVDFRSPVPCEVRAADGTTKIYTMIVLEASRSDKKLLTFIDPDPVSGAVGTVNETNKTVAITLSHGTTSFTPAVGISGKDYQPKEAWNVVPGANTKTYTVTAEDGSSQAYRVIVTVQSQGVIGVTPDSAPGDVTITITGYIDTVSPGSGGVGSSPPIDFGDPLVLSWRYDTLYLTATSVTDPATGNSVSVTDWQWYADYYYLETHREDDGILYSGWTVDGAQSATLIIKARYFTLAEHRIILVITTSAGVVYSKTVTFTVE
ncbi:hypothetical protein AGMMS49944_27070 [Spirochaetia bacterium]|nr:hypothetical protein AGMMS49944_27070 [Spirochaetia bacterium]